jgi:DNA polymerase-3 subunit gamma/tau
VRDALSLLDQCSASETIDLDAVYYAMGLAGNRRTAALMDCILNRQTEKAIRDFNALWMDGKDPAVLLSELTGLLRDALMMKIAPKGGTSLISGGYDGTTLEALGTRMTREELVSAMDALQGAQMQIRSGASPKTTAELCLVCLCDSSLSDSTSALKARISRLEEQLKNGVTVRPAESQPDGVEEELPPPPEEEYPEPAGYVPVYTETEEPEAEETGQPVDAKSSPVEAAEHSVSWKEIAAEAAPTLPRDISMQLNDPKTVRGRLEGQILKIEVMPGFLYGRFNKPEVLAKFSETASRLAGREIRTALSELTDDTEAPRRSLEDLKEFKEVRFV